MSNSSEIDKDQLYGEFQRTERWRDRLWRKVTHKALDIADEDMNVNVSNKNGFGWKELLVIAALIGGGSFGSAWLLFDKLPDLINKPQPQQQHEDKDTDTRYNLEFIP